MGWVGKTYRRDRLRQRLRAATQRSRTVPNGQRPEWSVGETACGTTGWDYDRIGAASGAIQIKILMKYEYRENADPVKDRHETVQRPLEPGMLKGI
jgi:hypothetical protein